jgi:hypothetical protein
MKFPMYGKIKTYSTPPTRIDPIEYIVTGNFVILLDYRILR